MTAEMVAQVRRFNRTVTHRIGVLNDNFLASDRPLGQNRLLWEIGGDGCDVRSLRARLELDSGYISRLLRTLEERGLAVVEQSSADGRVRTVRLTEGKSPGVVGFRSPVADGAGCPAGVSLTVPGWAIA
jgi:hypothetical protein